MEDVWARCTPSTSTRKSPHTCRSVPNSRSGCRDRVPLDEVGRRRSAIGVSPRGPVTGRGADRRRLSGEPCPHMSRPTGHLDSPLTPPTGLQPAAPAPAASQPPRARNPPRSRGRAGMSWPSGGDCTRSSWRAPGRMPRMLSAGYGISASSRQPPRPQRERRATVAIGPRNRWRRCNSVCGRPSRRRRGPRGAPDG